MTLFLTKIQMEKLKIYCKNCPYSLSIWKESCKKCLFDLLKEEDKQEYGMTDKEWMEEEKEKKLK